MGRIRTVKPELYKNEQLFRAWQDCGPVAYVVFIGLFNFSDREGRFKWQPRALSSEIIPYMDNVDMESVLNSLVQHELITRYTDGKKIYGCIPAFKNLQHIHCQEPGSSLPDVKDCEVIASDPRKIRDKRTDNQRELP